MSGGSFNYLFARSADELPQHLEDLSNMASYLTVLDAHDAAAETEDVVRYILHARRQVEARMAHLADVWKSAECHASGDRSRAQLDQELERYRAE
jgi:hypothetical protein